MVSLGSIALALVSTMVALGNVNAQLPIPGKPPGFTYGHGTADAGVQLETYVDLMCPASAAAFPGLKILASHYKPEEFRLKFVLFPLPYHQYAFTAAESAFTIASALGEDHFPVWLETLYTNQELYWNKKTKDLSTVQVTENFYKLAKKTFPGLKREDWERQMPGYGGTDADSKSRESWKYTCSRSVSGTPMYTLNGVPFDADAEWSFEDWKKVVDPLVKANHAKSSDVQAIERS